jgi:hypothetical protein
MSNQDRLAARILTRHRSAVTRRLAGDTVILPVHHNVADLTAVYTLNETASFVWDQLDGTQTVGQLVDQIIDRYEVSPEDAARGVLALIEDLEAEGLVQGN